MVQFLLTGKDGKDKDALDRRMAARPAHLSNAEEMQKRGELLMGAAILSEDGKMVGSIMVFNFPSRAELDAYLKDEPYVVGNVWQDIEIQNIAVGAHFMPAVKA